MEQSIPRAGAFQCCFGTGAGDVRPHGLTRLLHGLAAAVLGTLALLRDRGLLCVEMAILAPLVDNGALGRRAKFRLAPPHVSRQGLGMALANKTSAEGTAYVGTSGWSYAAWKPGFYPKGLAQRDWLSHYAKSFRTVELNASFYRLPTDQMVKVWTERSPDGFVFAVKAWRAITHFRRLKDCGELLERFFERVAPLGAKLGPVIFQLPAGTERDAGTLAQFLSLLPGAQRFAFEFRDESWHTDDIYALLSRHNAAFCAFDFGGFSSPRIATADFVYARLHGPSTPYTGAYGARELGRWARWGASALQEGRDAFVYFDNTDGEPFAARDALKLDELIRRRSF